MTKQRAKELWDEWKWWLALVVFPAVALAAKNYDASKVDAHTFALYVQQQDAARVLHEVRDSARQENIYRQLKYLSCRVDGVPRRNCMSAP